MSFVLLSMKLSGIKNLDKEIELQFSNKILSKTINVRTNNVKAIYGSNGSGKTGIVCAVALYKSLVLERDFITISNSNGLLENLINQLTSTFSITMTFAECEDSIPKRVLSHSIVVKNDNGKAYISSEELIKLHGTRLNDNSKWQNIYSVIEGELTLCKSKDLYDMTKNLLKTQSVPSIAFSNFITYRPSKKEDSSVYSKISTVWNFALNIRAMFNSYDNYFNKVDDLNTQYLDSQKNDYLVPKSFYNLFEKRIGNLTRFLKVFKDDLEYIDIVKEEKNDKYICTLTLVYKDGRRIARKYESSGIKKMMDLYASIRDADEGKIVFIDEFDANIHDVVLIKLVDYIREYSDGQFVFTTHNLGPMDVLQKGKYSIDFLSEDSKITSWVQMGNSSASSVYRKGVIKYSPFNIESFSFLGVFGDGTSE